MPTPLKRSLAILIIAATVGGFIFYLRSNPAVLGQLKNTSPLLVVGLTGLYLLTVPLLALILRANLNLCGSKQLPIGENLLLTGYSAIANFFGPLQSGPGVRAVYLKQKHSVSMKQFGLASLVYYAFLGGLSLATILLAGGYGVLALAGTATALVIFAVLRTKLAMLRRTRAMVIMLVVTAVQVLLMAIIYFVELRSVNPATTFQQAVAYAGFANLSLFASLTPGALGIREGLLLLTEQIHHINQATVVAASLLDRAVYIIYLSVLFIGSLLLQAQDRLVSKATVPTKPQLP